MIKIKEAIIVEGRYDKNTLSQIIDATIIETSGFAIRNNKERLELIRRIAERRGIIILTDSDGAGFLIRNYLKGVLPKEQIKHAYIPEIQGKEKRKNKASGEGILGVEGMNKEILLASLKNAGASIGDEISGETEKSVTKADLYEDGLFGREDSTSLREQLLTEMRLPKKLSTNALVDVINILYSYDAYKSMISKIKRL